MGHGVGERRWGISVGVGEGGNRVEDSEMLEIWRDDGDGEDNEGR